MHHFTSRATAALACFLSLPLLSACISEAAERPAGDPSWRTSSLWDDGLAEFAVYDVDWFRYGALHPGRAILVVVKEPWAPELDVKADTPRPDGFDVLKLNHIRDVPTGIYTYHQMASVFWRRDDGSLRKISTSSAEACGISTGYMVGGQLETHSYFDGQGDATMAWPDGAVPQDGLPASLREYVQGTVPDSLDLFTPLMAGRFQTLEAATWKLHREAPAPVEVAAGTFQGVELRLTQGDHFLSYTFDSDPPHVLLHFKDDAGTEYRLAKLGRIAYWQMHDRGGEEWLPEGLR